MRLIIAGTYYQYAEHIRHYPPMVATRYIKDPDQLLGYDGKAQIVLAGAWWHNKCYGSWQLAQLLDKIEWENEKNQSKH
jgi:hypothetical protein